MRSKLEKWSRDLLLLVGVIILAVWLGQQMPAWYSKFKGPFKTGDYSQHVRDQPYRLTLYGTTTCPHCAAARKFLKESGIEFNDLLVDESKTAEAAFSALGESAVPVLLSDSKLVVGFNKEAYLELATSRK